ncbi:hypothetical protein EJ06DRAFT_474760 [Trichodelitschia bisporula]|uniref:SWI/SNF chromatin remodeling complex component n=1 Tax=Trichodelitschia bisporula TaxID=703511 RepID=A0A6G1I146_9PEZI|nr:hypothetical protein EJ06DRAFT_474760 [Trichodelitschia bisporula]
MVSTPLLNDTAVQTPDTDPSLSSNILSEQASLEASISAAQRKHDEDMAVRRADDLALGEEGVDRKFKALEFLLKQSRVYSTIMLAQIGGTKGGEDEAKEEEEVKKEQEVEETPKGKGKSASKAGKAKGKAKAKKGQSQISDFLKREDVAAKADKGGVAAALKQEAEDTKDSVHPGEVGFQEVRTAKQPKLVTGGTMRKYQLEGLSWLTSLYENGLNGILADEMGLGKTIQTIAFLAFLREMGSNGPFLVAAPLSTTSNWVNEFKKWTPEIPVVLYHGTKVERGEIRRKRLKKPGSPGFPVVITSYEICMNDRKFLAGMGWKFIIIDEGHRIKNLNCRLVRELQSYQSANRLLITGTPLQNNLTELWSLLHFLMPEIFDKLEAFESWFDFSELKDAQGYEQLLTEDRQKTLVTSLHAILKPFLLRRVKADVEKSLPRKREYVLYAPLTTMQQELYQAILEGSSRSFLEEKALERLSLSGTGTPSSTRSASRASKKRTLDIPDEPSKSAKSSRAATPSSGRSTRARRQDYKEISDSAYFASLEAAATESSPEPEPELTPFATSLMLAKRQISNKKLQNPLMQLRLCCDHPYNFFNPFTLPDPDAPDADVAVDETVVTASGKMVLLDALLPALFKGGHKVLIFSQFKTQLDLLGLYAELRGWAACRIDGSVAQADRQAQIDAFNAPPGAEEAVNLFLLSTRAGGVGINLAAADTVVLFDSDWNPQMDLQAQDRAHRIGQRRPVIVYRLATRGTVEQDLLESAEGKRRLEKLVIRKGGVTGRLDEGGVWRAVEGRGEGGLLEGLKA